ncbi:hypothetical protein ACUNWD_13355 [Sunxiuqinia sp. A32]|uniref:hypothetical protein n=1 Tax=Sunxiuqinia sp. A32 TaxID=3461496 RepID=UPI004045AE66
MKKIIQSLLIVTILIAGVSGSKSFAQKSKTQSNKPYRHILLSVGYAPDKEFKALKGNIMLNNLLLKRFGVYTSFEGGIDDYSQSILGATFGINKYLFLYGGIDLADNEKLSDIEVGKGSTRKEAGIGITPYKFTAATLGWSKGVGFTFTVGINIPLFDKRP